MTTDHYNSQSNMLFYDLFNFQLVSLTMMGCLYLPYPLLRNNVLRKIIVLYCLLTGTAIVVCFGYFTFNVILKFAPYLIVSLEYICTVYYLALSNLKYREEIIKNLEVINDNLDSHETMKLYMKSKKMFTLWVLWIIFFRIALLTYVYFLMDKYYWRDLPAVAMAGLIVIFSEIQQLPRIMLFLTVKSRIQVLRERVENVYNTSISRLNSTAQDRIKHIASYHTIYMHIMDIVEDMGRFVNPMYLLSLALTFPKVIWLINDIVGFYAKGIPLEICCVMCAEILQWVVFPCAPGVVVELTEIQVNKMSLFMTHKMRDCKDEKEQSALKAFVKYINFRPFSYEMLWVIHVNGKICLIVFSVIAKAFIVVAAQRLLKAKK